MDSEGGAAPQAPSGGETSAPDAAPRPAEASTAPQSQGATPSKRRNSTGKFPGGDAAGVAAAVAAAASAGIPLVEKVHASHDEKGGDGNAPPARIRRGSFKGTFGTDERKIDTAHHEGSVVHSYQDPSTSTLSSKGGAVMGGAPTIPRRRRASHGMGTLYAAATHSNSAVAAGYWVS